VFAVPGPSALTAALSVAGLDAVPSMFLGFLPKGRGERLSLLGDAAASARTLVIFESAGRLPRLLTDLAELFDDPEVVVCRELTKLHEEVVRSRASALATRFRATRGECTLVVQVPPPAASEFAAEGLADYMGEMKRAGARRSPAAVEAARRFGVSREAAYNAWPSDA
jgi:16S rRNA (cytidine1402-2'-O)-methyltransferase